MEKRGCQLLYLLVAVVSLLAPAYAQTGIPLPGAQSAQAMTSAPLPGTAAAEAGRPVGSYQALPLNSADAQAQIDELKQLITQGRPKELQERVLQLCDWLNDMAEAHYKLAATFAKADATRSAGDAERLAGRKFSQLKNQALLLKADLLIRQQRYPESLGPLVEVVVQEPRSATGEAAYRRLKEIGFSQEPEAKTAPSASATPAPLAHEAVQSEGQSADHVVSRPALKVPVTTRGPAAVAAPKAPAVWIKGTPFGSGSGVKH